MVIVFNYINFIQVKEIKKNEIIQKNNIKLCLTEQHALLEAKFQTGAILILIIGEIDFKTIWFGTEAYNALTFFHLKYVDNRNIFYVI